MELTINPLFKQAMPPLSGEEYSQLEQNIIKHGCREAIITWNGTIIDGHNRYEICQKHGIPFKTRNKNFLSRKCATLWVLSNQLGKRNLTNTVRIELALQKAELTGSKKEPLHVTVARDAGVSRQTVQKYMRLREIPTATEGRTYNVTMRRMLFTPEEIAERMKPLQPGHAQHVQDNIAKTEKIYNTLQKNFPLLSPKDLGRINKQLTLHNKLLEGCFG